MKVISTVGGIIKDDPNNPVPTYLREYLAHQGPQLYTYKTSLYRVMDTHTFNEEDQKWIFRRIRDKDDNIIDEA